MPATPSSTDTAGTSDPEGVISGAVLREIRRTLGLHQEQIADGLGLDLNTYRSHEHGRRPLARVSVQRMRTLRHGLHRLGADNTTLGLLDTAVDVDLAVKQVLTGDHNAGDHPLGAVVHTRTWHDLLGWAITGRAPKTLANGTDIPRPRLAVPDRQALLDKLRTTAEKSTPQQTLLRRQVYFVASWDDTGPGRDWLAKAHHGVQRQIRNVDGWTPLWVAGRSLAVAKAVSGDPEQLRHFIAHQLASDDQEIANLNYWANWSGDDHSTALTDDFMKTPDLGAWRGTELLRHLTAGLHAATAYVDLTIHTVWALLERRPWLLDDDPALTTTLRTRAQHLLDDSQQLSDQARRELDQIFYATKMRRHT